jgi:hypothetical protein
MCEWGKGVRVSLYPWTNRSLVHTVSNIMLLCLFKQSVNMFSMLDKDRDVRHKAVRKSSHRDNPTTTEMTANVSPRY